MKVARLIRLRRWTVLSLILAPYLLSNFSCHSPKAQKEWRYYNGSPTSNKYSSLSQINKTNVYQLEVAWTYQVPANEEYHTTKCNPLVVDGTLYGITAGKNLIALNASSGEEIWYIDFHQYDSIKTQGTARGIHYWEKGNDKRIFYVYAENLYAINALDGTLVKSFGEDGKVPFNTGIDANPKLSIRATTPGIIYKDLLIIGSFVAEQLPSAPGDIRAFSTITGELQWVFHTIPRPGEYGYDTWPLEAYQNVGGANNWTGMSLDEKRGIVYIPTGSATFDFYGANRHGQNLFANSLIALNAKTGERIWHYQIVHHDLWDRDLPCAPNLLSITQNGKQIDVVAQPTKQGYVYVFDRETGKPIFDIEEVPVPPSMVEGELAWPTQPIPLKPPPFTRQEFSADQITNISPEANAYVKHEISKYKTARFTPGDTSGVVLVPEFAGGAGWGGAAIDEPTATLVINANDTPGLLKLVDREAQFAANWQTGEKLYQLHCASCHGQERQGAHFYPSLIGLEKSYSPREVRKLITNGSGLMPAMDQIPNAQKSAIVAFLFGQEIKENSQNELKKSVEEKTSSPILKYAHRGNNRFSDQEGFPAIKPPWATLTAMDLNKGEIKWQEILGEYPELTARGIPPTGAFNLGGPIVTAGGLIFIAATMDNKFRAFDLDNGELLWEYELGGQGIATPITYEVNGEQYVVIAVSDTEEIGFIGRYLAFKVF